MDNQRSKHQKYAFLYVQAITFVRIPLALAFAIVLLSTERSSSTLLTCFLLVILIEFTDCIDGILIRRAKLVTEYGSLFDPYADSISRMIVYWALANADLLNSFTFIAIAVRDITVAYARILLMKHSQSVSARISGKIKAIVQGIGAALAVVGPLYWHCTGTWTIRAISWTIVIVTLASSIEYVMASIVAFAKMEPLIPFENTSKE